MKPSSLKAGWAIAKRELVDQATSLRFLAILLLVVFMTPLSIYVGVKDYQARLDDFELLRDRKDLLTKALERQIWGVDDESTAINELIVLRVLRSPQPLSILVHGLDGALPKYWDFSKLGIEPGPPASTDVRLADTFQHLDFEFLIRAVLGLLAALLGYDAVVGEKENGTLRAALSHPISRRLFLSGKLLGGAATLLFALGFCFLIALLSCWSMAPSGLVDRNFLSQLALIGASSVLYLICFYTLGLTVSSLTSSQKTSLLVTLVVWFLLVLAVAPLATLLARALSPVQTVQSLMAKKDEKERQISGRESLEMGDVYRDVTGSLGGQISQVVYNQYKQELDPRIAPVAVSYQNERRQALGQMDQDYEDSLQKQNNIARIIMMLSPALAFASVCTDLAGTGDVHYASWQSAIRLHYQQLSEALFENPPAVRINNLGAVSPIKLGDPVPLGSLPRFAPPSEDPESALRRALPACGVLLLYSLLILMGGFAAFSRYDVR